MGGTWGGRWAADNAGITVRTVSSATGDRLEELIGIGLRRNPKRVQLLVSTVLGKHIPTDPHLISEAGHRLGGLVRDALAAGPPPTQAGKRRVVVASEGSEPATSRHFPDDSGALVIGFAETATLLGHLVADELGAPYIHSTRRFDSGVATWSEFTEAHSHATGHALQPSPPALMERGEAVVLVDDEISTARTALGTIEALHALVPRPRYVIAALIDMTTAADQLRVADTARSLDASIQCVSLVRGAITVPDGVRVPADSVADPGRSADPGRIVRLPTSWTDGVRESGRHGFEPGEPSYDRAISETARLVADALPNPGGRTRVLGTEELMYTPLRIALELPGEVRFSTTTRSPAVVIDEPGYPLRHGIVFPAHEAGASGGVRFAYNIAPGGQDQIVLVLDEGYDTPQVQPLLDRLARLASLVVVVTVPCARPEG